VLQTAIQASPRDSGLHHALGLALVRAKRLGDALSELQRAAELGPEQARYTYVYAVALHSAGRKEEAIDALKVNFARHPNDRDTIMALISFYRDAGNFESALEYAERLAQMTPNNHELDNLIATLRRQIKKPAMQ
jgi:Flp pilus assembly protein TadD